MQTINLTRRAQSLLPASYRPIPRTLQLIAAYAAKNPGLEFGNYCSSWADKSGRAAYLSESRRITRALKDVRDNLREAHYAGVTDADIIEACKRAYGGRLTVTPDGIDYCTGQYWPTEYRAACASVLLHATAIAISRQVDRLAA